jgi:DnaJ-class molecular chaperone
MQRVNFGGFIMNQQVEVASEERCRDITSDVELDLEPGMQDGTQQDFPLMGDHREGMIPGSIVVSMIPQKHAVFRRAGDDLHAILLVPLRGALLGFNQSLTHLDKHEVWVSAEDVSAPGRVLTLKNKGMPKRGSPSERGDLFVELQYDMPKSLDPRQRSLLGQALL